MLEFSLSKQQQHCLELGMDTLEGWGICIASHAFAGRSGFKCRLVVFLSQGYSHSVKGVEGRL